MRFVFFPSFLLQVTNGRASPDYANSLNTFIGSSSLLFWAAGLRPSKDNFWTSDGARKKRHFLRCRFYTTKPINLPRQAWDKHRKSVEREGVLCMQVKSFGMAGRTNQTPVRPSF